jgi:hypothetical protein
VALLSLLLPAAMMAVLFATDALEDFLCPHPANQGDVTLRAAMNEHTSTSGVLHVLPDHAI